MTMMHWLLCTVIAATFLSSSHADTLRPLSLTGPDSPVRWAVSNNNGSVRLTDIQLPNSIHTLLYTHNITQHPLHQYNELLQRWVAEEDWTYTAIIPPSVLQQYFASEQIVSANGDPAYLELLFHGIDTVSLITLNEAGLLYTDNMHRSYSATVEYIPELTYRLAIRIGSSLDEAQLRESVYPYSVPVADPAMNLPHRNFIRKGQSDFGWDWGPAYASSGIWKSIELIGSTQSRNARITDIVIQQIHQPDDYISQHTDPQRLERAPREVVLEIDVYLRATHQYPAMDVKFVGQLLLSTGKEDASMHCFDSQETIGSNTAQTAPPHDRHQPDQKYRLTCLVEKPLLWWTNGILPSEPWSRRNATMYTLTVSDQRQQLQPFTKRFGFRCIELVQDPQPGGASFYFRLNGIPIFAKGANVIPMNAFHAVNDELAPTELQQNTVTTLLQSARDANFNMVRVWGGGVYQTDEFYDLADDYGLMVWQEFMFACALYPTDDDFLANVREEVLYQTRRLASHPSIVVFGGNNENEGAVMGWFAESKSNLQRYVIDYVRLYIDTVRPALLEVLPNAIFVDSSPSKGVISADPYTKTWEDVGGDTKGDVHYYDYGVDCMDIEKLGRGKFVSEFGWQSLPSLHSWQQEAGIKHKDMDYKSDFLQYRQRHEPTGNADLLEQIGRYFLLPNSLNLTKRFEDYIYLTQVAQSICYTNAIQLWRASKNDAEHGTMGALYWQLNDVWTAPTWSSIEYGRQQRWKLLHYAISNVYEELIVAAWLKRSTNEVVVNLVNDALQPQTVKLTIRVWRWADSAVVYKQQMDGVQVDALGSKLVLTMPVQQLVGADGKPKHYFVTIDMEYYKHLEDQQWDYPVKKQYPVYLTPLKEVNLPRSEYWYGTIAIMNNISFGVCISGSEAAPYTFFSTAIAGRWSDNGFLQLPGNDTVCTTFTAEKPLNTQFDFDIRILASTHEIEAAMYRPNISVTYVYASTAEQQLTTAGGSSAALPYEPAARSWRTGLITWSASAFVLITVVAVCWLTIDSIQSDTARLADGNMRAETAYHLLTSRYVDDQLST